MNQPSQNLKFMKLAAACAIDGIDRNHGGPFGAVIVKDGKIVAKAHNEVLKTNDPTMHAEINAIRKASKRLGLFDLSGCTLFTSCMPCPMCLGAIKWANIKVVYYGATSKDADEIGFRDEVFYSELNIEKIKGLELLSLGRSECLAPFKKWQEKINKKFY